MTLRETISSGHIPDETDQVSAFKVLRSGAGYYIGTTYLDHASNASMSRVPRTLSREIFNRDPSKGKTTEVLV